MLDLLEADSILIPTNMDTTSGNMKIGNGTLSDLGKLPTPMIGAVKFSYKKKKKKR